MQRGRYKCKQLKAVRKRVAEENGIPLEQRECTYDGPCKGTCPHCEAEVRYLERALTERIRMGRAATVAGLGLSLAACGGGQGSVPVLTTDSTLPAVDTLPSVDTLSLDDKDTVYPKVTTTGLMIMDDDDSLLSPPPPPPPSEPCFTDAIVGEVDDEEIEGEVAIIQVVEVDPEFPGGMDSLYAWIARNTNYPLLARENNIDGTVYIQFVVEKDGSISTAHVLRDIGFGCGEEALRVVNNMPKWKPGRQRGKPVRARYTLPIRFNLK